ncbi:MAG: ROK family protein [Culicoidibacterales bacterium]
MATIGIDIGGTQTRIALVENGIIQQQQRMKTDTENPERHLQAVLEIIATFAAEYTAIGVSCPGPLDLQTGTILTPPNLPGWHYFPLVAYLSEKSQTEVKIDNDANCAALAEAVLGAGKAHEIVQFMTVSTGIGAGLVIHQQIFSGAHGLACEVANVIVDDTNTVEGNTIQGSVERIGSGTGIYRLALQSGLPVKTTADVFRLAEQGNPQAYELLEYVSDKLANFLASLQGIIDPSVIVIGGSVALHNPNFVEKIGQKMRKRVYPTVQPYLNIVIAECGDAAGVLGAALLAK